jgi:hypothetical protein
MKPVFEKLQLLEIPPDQGSTTTQYEQRISPDVTERLLRRAEGLRKNWSKGNGAASRSPSRGIGRRGVSSASIPTSDHIAVALRQSA